MGRAVGIHLVLATQRPDADHPHRPAAGQHPGEGRVRDLTAADSRIVLDDTGAEKLQRGELLIRLPGSRETLKLRGRRVSEAAIAAKIRAAAQRGIRP